MSPQLLNVRLDDARVRKVRTLRKCGITLSDVVRVAIDEKFEELQRSTSARDVHAIIHGLFERYPDPPNLAPRGYDVHDRRAARAAILRKLKSAKP